MKINVEIDCTPLEAREFMGLPDVQPMQAAILENVQARMMASLESLSPEGLMKTWFDPKMAERFQDLFGGLSGLGSGRAPKGKT
jgi:Family of unknown function (DUF6489)